jgi:hypothetical protein
MHRHVPYPYAFSPLCLIFGGWIKEKATCFDALTTINIATNRY